MKGKNITWRKRMTQCEPETQWVSLIKKGLIWGWAQKKVETEDDYLEGNHHPQDG